MPPRIKLLAAIRHASSYPISGSARARNGVIGGCGGTKCTSPFAGLISTTQATSYQRRMNSTSSDSGKDGADEARGPNQDQLPHVSEEAAQTAKILNKRCGDVGGPELEQGTPVEEILKRDKDALKNMPKVLRDEIAAKNNSGSRSFSTYTRQRQQDMQNSVVEPSAAAVAEMIAAAGEIATLEKKGYKFDPPSTDLPRSENLKRRYEPLVDQFTKMLMKDGKLSLAQKVCSSSCVYHFSPPCLMIAEWLFQTMTEHIFVNVAYEYDLRSSPDLTSASRQSHPPSPPRPTNPSATFKSCPLSHPSHRLCCSTH
ncbi:hypothetical protein CISG_01456 [Coccidioides immitis RMSCC 3703]|uniref:Uncharacterized protein n=1 Tax=Coccidioides immitis RMSCC 3703 TaxID=454286 RepID=A0A0J8QXT0_COCIT|nr:hypothetical protein CISG_01456 [Coccidioides immitis RMSCC 3703]